MEMTSFEIAKEIDYDYKCANLILCCQHHNGVQDVAKCGWSVLTTPIKPKILRP